MSQQVEELTVLFSTPVPHASVALLPLSHPNYSQQADVKAGGQVVLMAMALSRTNPRTPTLTATSEGPVGSYSLTVTIYEKIRQNDFVYFKREKFGLCKKSVSESNYFSASFS